MKDLSHVDQVKVLKIKKLTQDLLRQTLLLAKMKRNLRGEIPIGEEGYCPGYPMNEAEVQKENRRMVGLLKDRNKKTKENMAKAKARKQCQLEDKSLEQ